VIPRDPVPGSRAWPANPADSLCVVGCPASRFSLLAGVIGDFAAGEVVDAFVECCHQRRKTFALDQ